MTTTDTRERAAKLIALVLIGEPNDSTANVGRAWLDLGEKSVDALLRDYYIRPKAAPSITAPEPTVGQVWRNKSSDRLVRVAGLPGEIVFSVEMQRTYKSQNIRWEAITGGGPGTGSVSASYWTSKFEYVADRDESGETS